MASPWEQFAPATLEFCENLLGGWIRQPANTWSNLGFLIVGVLLWKKTPITRHWLRTFSIGSVLVGITSAAYHLSMTFNAQFFDVASMFLTAGILVVLNLMRLRWIEHVQIYKFLVGMQLFFMLLMFQFQGALGEQIFTGQVFFIVLSEIYLIRRDRPSLHQYRWWIASIAIYAVATLVWILDLKKIWCDADNHWFSGHALWHLLNAVVVWTLYRFYEEIIVVPGPQKQK